MESYLFRNERLCTALNVCQTVSLDAFVIASWHIPSLYCPGLSIFLNKPSSSSFSSSSSQTPHTSDSCWSPGSNLLSSSPRPADRSWCCWSIWVGERWPRRRVADCDCVNPTSVLCAPAPGVLGSTDVSFAPAGIDCGRASSERDLLNVACNQEMTCLKTAFTNRGYE